MKSKIETLEKDFADKLSVLDAFMTLAYNLYGQEEFTPLVEAVSTKLIDMNTMNDVIHNFRDSLAHTDLQALIEARDEYVTGLTREFSRII